MPIDNLKIDQRFVQRMNSAGNTRKLVKAIVELAHSLGMRRAQSYLLARPAPALCVQALLVEPEGSNCWPLSVDRDGRAVTIH
ncbi:MAG TPA: hypothetical protein VMT86_03720 [Bryobacteraceae bacterium]|nr:hypothetical protein [Bryobacteraceae bacterium]